ncbi:hypothetical protein TrCOL_g11124 [Triparma columacea]|uniref:Uncharacterized protein n=1 Tax=Triparma columacea TaxID=722753 RepID=A0A9W7GN56_9STRA|nr:hypothetical protein TrCOL_g11124 [Triparma columacea]
MFKALKGKAAAALDAAAATTSGGGGDTKELEAKMASMEKELKKKTEALTKIQTKLKKAEETEQKLLGDVQKKEAELSRNNKQLDKFKKEGASASGALQSKMDEKQKELDEANEKITGAYKERDDAMAKMEELTKQMEAMKSLADSSTALQKELEVSYSAIGEQEKKFQDRIVTLRKQLEVAERKVMNAKYMSESHEQLSAETQMRLFSSQNTAAECDRRLQRSLERYASLEHDLQMDRLTNQVQEGRTRIQQAEQSIRECYSDPLLKVPAGTAKRRQLKKFEEKLKTLRRQQKSQSEFLNQITNVGDSNDLMRTAANNNDIPTIKRLLKQGISCNVPDETGFSAFKYACGKGHMHVIRLMLDHADIQDEDGRLTPLILAAKNAHDSVVKLLIKRGALIDATDQIGRTALHVACDNNNRSTALELLDLGCQVSAVDKKGNTALHYCAQRNFAPIARLLLDRGIVTDQINVDGLTAINIAMEAKNQRVVEVLVDDRKQKQLKIQLENEENARISTGDFENSLIRELEG